MTVLPSFQSLRMAALAGCAALSPLLLSACASAVDRSDPDAVAAARESNDPLEPANRVFYRINDGIDTVVLRPVAKAYVYAVPQVVRTHTHEFLANLSSPVSLANDIMQAKPRRAGDTLMRLLINSTVGVAGLFDVATDWGYPQHDTDFGVTLALWGVGEGPYLFLPVFGPSNPRDATGLGADIALDPLTWIGKGPAVTALSWSRYGVTAVDTRAQYLDQIDQIKAGALDPYATFRSLYRQHRASVIQGTRDDRRATTPDWFPQPPPATP